jgi:hypothetical protein
MNLRETRLEISLTDAAPSAKPLQRSAEPASKRIEHMRSVRCENEEEGWGRRAGCKGKLRRSP